MVYPEERMGVDNVMSCMVTVADVEVSGDLQVVKVFVSILGDERGKKNAINGLKKMEGYVRRNIGKRVSLRLTPDIRFADLFIHRLWIWRFGNWGTYFRDQRKDHRNAFWFTLKCLTAGRHSTDV